LWRVGVLKLIDTFSVTNTSGASLHGYTPDRFGAGVLGVIRVEVLVWGVIKLFRGGAVRG